MIRAASVLVGVTAVLAAAPAGAGSLSMDEAVALALRQNRDVIAARLDINAAELDKLAVSIYPNPTFLYALGNLVVGPGNAQGMGLRPTFLDQPVQSLSVGELIDVWRKRAARIATADKALHQRRLAVEDALRESVFAVRSAFGDLVRERSERHLSHETADRYAETIRISRSRQAAGDISAAELNKIELEGLGYQNAVIDADTEYDLARQKLAALIAIPTAALPEVEEPPLPNGPFALDDLTARALAHRPDLLATRAAQATADASLTAARREVLPDLTFGVDYTHSSFTVSGDNPSSVGVSLSFPLPVFDRNQAGVGRAQLERTRAANDTARVEIMVRHDVADAVRKAQRSRALVDVFRSGMLERADRALNVAENAYKAGASTLLEVLEARRTYIETRARYLRAQYELQQAVIEIRHTVADGSN